jgi:hypothetical protein
VSRGGEDLTVGSMGWWWWSMGLADVVRRRNHKPIGRMFSLYNVRDGRSRGYGTTPLVRIGRLSGGHEVIEFCRAVASCNDKIQAYSQDVRE